MKKTILIVAALVACVAMSAQPTGGFGGFQMPQIKVDCSEKFADVNYAADGKEYHNLDIYLPKVERKSYPVVVHIYGSAWYANNAKGMADLGTIVNSLLNAGYAVVTPNHRSSSDAKFPAQINDIKAVIRFLRANAVQYRLDPSFIATSGFSSGGHLSTLAATAGGVKELEGKVGKCLDESSAVDAACDWSGPIDLMKMDCAGPREMTASPEEDLLGIKFKGNEDKFKVLSPISYIDSSDPPVIIFHGTKDNVVPPCQAPMLFEALDSAGVDTELYMVEGGGHGFNMYSDDNLNKMVAFLDRVRSEKNCKIVSGTNPLINGQFSADPTAKVFEDKVYLYPSHDIISPVEPERKWFSMADYHVFSSEDLTVWTDHGVILSQENVPWGKSDAYSMWAPDCVEKGGKYYFFFPDAPAEGRGFAVGVAVSDKPYGPFVPEAKPIAGVMGIDPCVLLDDDGSAYIYWGGMGLRAARLKDNLLELADTSVQVDKGLPQGFKEGPFAFKRDGHYYLTYPWVQDKTETLAYAMSDSPLGPFEYKGLIMEQSPTGCWTNHHSLVQYKGQWYLFYHHNDYSPNFDKNRSVRADKVYFNEDGTIRQVIPTLRGIGHISASSQIQVDRYSDIKGASIDYLDSLDCFKGWKTVFSKKGDSVRFDDVDFSGIEATSSVVLRVRCSVPAQISISTGNRVNLDIAACPDWQTLELPFKTASAGMQNLEVVLRRGSGLELDWISFK